MLANRYRISHSFPDLMTCSVALKVTGALANLHFRGAGTFPVIAEAIIYEAAGSFRWLTIA